MNKLPAWLTRRPARPIIVQGTAGSWSVPVEISPEQHRREILPPGSRGEVYARGMDVGFMLGTIYGAFLVIVAGATIWLTTSDRFLNFWSSRRSTALARQDPQVIPERRVPSPPTPTEIPAPPVSVPSRPSCLERGPNLAPGECCVPARDHLTHAERFVPDPQYQGRGRWVCGGTRGTQAVRNHDGSIDVTRCNWCEP